MNPRWGPIGRLVARRLGFAVPVVLLVSLGMFVLAAAAPLDAVRAHLGDRASLTDAQTRAAIARRLGAEDNVFVRWVSWLGDALRGDLGVSTSFRQPVADVIGARLGWTLLLVAVGLAGGLLLGAGLGALAAVRRGTRTDRVVSGLAVTVESTPPFWLALAAMWVAAVQWRWLPTGGLTDPGAAVDAAQVLRHLVLPATVLAVVTAPWFVLFARQTLRQALAEDFVAGALARGVSRRRILLTHAAPAAAPAFLALLGARLPELVTGAVLIEAVFSWPGVGAASVQAALAVDMALLAGLTVLATAAVLLGTLLADALAAVLDPRVATDG